MSRNNHTHNSDMVAASVYRQRNPHGRAIPLHLNSVPDCPRNLLTHYASKRLETNRKAFTHILNMLFFNLITVLNWKNESKHHFLWSFILKLLLHLLPTHTLQWYNVWTFLPAMVVKRKGGNKF